MQKFGLDALQTQSRTALDLEMVKEQANALGMAGKKLRHALEAYGAAELQAFPIKNEDKLLSATAEAVYGLLLQRKFLGFTETNLEWARSCYPIPDKAMPLLGTKINNWNHGNSGQ